ncbi:MAG TPA: Nif3-like dinuclear metal center hexameric protein, partial [Candidatus Sulfotelmatobacter sp.]|nr:Nif3-like dinuclear metal center hexameric protein [Candidatus Sulfotelmatobacter sp.]
MATVSLKHVVLYCNRLLRPDELEDYERAANGLQVENRGTISRIGATVDASLATVKLAVAAKVDLLLVHHGLFWGPTHPWTGKRYELLRVLLDNDLAVYSSHLPLDGHPRLGNNAQLCRAIGLKTMHPFFFDHGQYIGFQAQARLTRQELARR